MKTLKQKAVMLFSALILLSIFLFNFINPETKENQYAPPPPQNPWLEKFYIGAQNDEFDKEKNGNYNNLNTLGLNLWQNYLHAKKDANGRHYPYGWFGRDDIDQLLDPVSSYAWAVNIKISEIYNSSPPENRRKLLACRPKIEWLTYGQRSTYQCENISNNHPLWFYAFQLRAGETMRDFQYNNGDSVLYVSSIESGPGAKYVLSRLKSNSEQSFRQIFTDDDNSGWTGDSECDWLIKPRIRIPQSFVTPEHLETPVCSIKVLAQDGQTVLKETVLKVKYFRDPEPPYNYNGEYKEEFNYFGDPVDLKISRDWATSDSYPWPRGNHNYYSQYDNQADIMVYWYDNCPMWLDYIRVDNDVADQLLNPINPNYNFWRQGIAEEVSLIGNIPIGNDYPILSYYMEYRDFNMMPCLAYVNHIIDSVSGGRLGLTQDFYEMMYQMVPFSDVATVENADFYYHQYIEKIGFKQIFCEIYPFNGCYINNQLQQLASKIPTTLPSPYGNNILAKPVSPSEYDEWLQRDINKNPCWMESGIGGDADPHCNTEQYKMYEYGGLFRHRMQLSNQISKLGDIPFILMPQIHHWYRDLEVRREPTSEEINMTVNTAVSYGVRGIQWFYYPSNDWGPGYFGKGIADLNGNLIEVNEYGQGENHLQPYKWEIVQSICNRMTNQWGSYLLNFDYDNTNSYIFDNPYERNALLNPSNSYFYDVLTYKIGSGPFPCSEDYPEGYPMGWIGECSDERYVQVATFQKNIEDGNQYFMLVNRRCSPFYNESSPDNNGGQRWIKLRFSANHPAFEGFNSWKIVDVATGRDVDSFDKRYYSFLDMGKFLPGEGKLYKITPVPNSGGTLVADEFIEDQTFTCEDTVWNDGHNITITGSSDVSFSDSATIIVEGGTFQSGDASGGPISNKITYTSAVSGHKWGGLRFTDANVKIYNSEFKQIASPAGSGFAINTVDCPLNDIRYDVFTSSTDTAGGVNIAYVNYSPFGAPPNSYVMYNNFAMNNSYSRAVQVQGFAGLTEGVYVKGNTMTSNGYATGIFLSTVTGGVIKNNNISGFETAINTMSSTCDLNGNTISNSTNESKGINAVESSVLNLAPSGSQWTGGMNNISNMIGNSVNLDIDAANFILTGGANAFDLLSTAEEPYHLYGSFVSESYNSNARGNCFKLSGNEITDPELPNNYLTNGYEQVTLDFISYNCSQSMPECSDIVSIGNGLYDTIPKMCGGGGSYKGEMSNVKRETGAFILTPKQLQDSIKIQMRHRNYTRVKTLCNELIGNFPESIEGISTLQTLYMAMVLSDTTTSSRSALKAFYEGLILNHGNNEALVEISNYLVQKCKVLLKQYTSALAGFQTIINNNQYNYRGLLARWDYMATSLLMQGQGGGESIKNYELGIMNSEADVTDEELALLDGYDKFGDDKNPYSKEERVAIQKNVRTVNEKAKNYGEKRIEILEREAKQNNQRAKNELQRINTMKQVIRTEKPKNVIEHIKIVNNDIQTVFGSTLSNKSTSINIIPSVYRLAQNYPNPFNPVTTIKYELPKDSKVKLVVYDLLGRELRTLVNETKSAGYYQIEFNMQNYASGVYFYRIEADDLSGKKFVDAKKMVLVK